MNSVNVARYASLIWHIIPFGYKSPTKWEIHLPESIFQTRSRTGYGILPESLSDVIL